MKKLSVLVAGLLLCLAFVSISPTSAAQSTTTSQESFSWISDGSYLNYSLGGSVKVSASNLAGSNYSFALGLNGTVRTLVNGISNGDANFTISPNLLLNETSKTSGATGHTSTHTETSSNESSSYTLSLDHFDALASFEQNLFSEGNSSVSTYLFSHNLNVSFTESPAALYTFNSNTLAALHLEGNISGSPNLNFFGLNGPYSIAGGLNQYYTLDHHIPLYIALDLNGTGKFTIPNFQGSSYNFSMSMSVNMVLKLLSTNVYLGPAQESQGSVSIPSYGTNLYVVSNDTLQGIGTAGNKLVVNVTGPSGTQGVLNVIVSQDLLLRAGLNNISQVAVTLDGTSYSNYTITQLGESYLITIYYHHSAHEMALSFGNANFGNNLGTVSQLSGSGAALPAETLEIIAIVVVAGVVLASIGAMKLRGKPVAVKPTL